MDMHKQAAFILFGGFATTRWPAFLTALKKRRLTILVVDEPGPVAERLLARRDADPEHVFRQMDEIVLAKNDNHPAIMQQVAEWTATFSIRGVCSIKDVFVEAAGLAADYLDVPSPGLRASRVCRNKHLQRIYLQQWSPQYALITPERRTTIADSFTAFPAVLKPTGRNSSSGVQLILNQEMLRSFLPQYPDNEVLLLEEQIVGCEFSIETLTQHGQTIFENITQKRTNEADSRFFVEMGHTIPAANFTAEETEQVLAVHHAVLQQLGFQDGISHAEYRLTEQGQVYLMEIAARNPGDSILLLYYMATLQDMEEALIKIALGEPTTYPRPVRHARQVYLHHPYGKLQDVLVQGRDDIEPMWFSERGYRRMPRLDGADAAAGVRELMVQRERGEQLKEITDSFDRSVSFLIDARTIEELDALEEQLRTQIMIVTTPE